MSSRDYISTPASEELGLQDIIKGLADDIKGLREGKVSIQDAQARAALAKQLFNGCRIYLQAAKTIQAQARPITKAMESPNA